MLLALLALYFFGSSGKSSIAVFDHVKASIKADVGDKARRTESLSIVEEAERVTKKDLKNREKIAKELLGLAERHEAKAVDMRPVLERVRADIEAYQEQMIRYRFALKAKMLREEWARVFPSEEPAQSPK